MTNEFTDICSRYYQLQQLLAHRNRRLQSILANAPLYANQCRINAIDSIIDYYRRTQAYKAKTDKIAANLQATAKNILLVMEYFEIPAHKVLTGEIPGELEYELWKTENDEICIQQTNSLNPLADNPNIINIRCLMGDEDETENDDEGW